MRISSASSCSGTGDYKLQNNVALLSLQSGCVYRVSVAARNEVGLGPFSKVESKRLGQTTDRFGVHCCF